MRTLCMALALLLLPLTAWADDEPAVLLFGGDVTLDWGYLEVVPHAFDDPAWPFRKLQPLISNVDVFMVNCESPITSHEEPQEKKFVFSTDPRLAQVFVAGGVNIVALANNHVMDHGQVGLEDTLRILDELGVAHVGAGVDLGEARRPVYMEIKGLRLAFLGYGNYSPAGPETPGVAYRYPRHIREDVSALREEGVDFIVVNFHWGVEKAPEPTDDDRKLAYLAIDSGADVVVGHHPHVLQPVEVYKGKVIAYSLGNLVFGGNSKRPRDSALLMVELHHDGTVEHRLLPVRIQPEETRYQPYLLEPVLRQVLTNSTGKSAVVPLSPEALAQEGLPEPARP